MKYCLDTNVFFELWYGLPQRTFPSLYRLLKEKLPAHAIVIEPIYNEIKPMVEKKSGERKNFAAIHDWVKNTLEIEKTPVDNEVKQKTLELEVLYETDPNNPKGASKADLALIAYAHFHGHTVVTMEGQQSQKPDKKSNYKIPLICQEQDVRCINLVRLLEELEIEV